MSFILYLARNLTMGITSKQKRKDERVEKQALAKAAEVALTQAAKAAQNSEARRKAERECLNPTETKYTAYHKLVPIDLLPPARFWSRMRIHQHNPAIDTTTCWDRTATIPLQSTAYGTFSARVRAEPTPVPQRERLGARKETSLASIINRMKARGEDPFGAQFSVPQRRVEALVPRTSTSSITISKRTELTEDRRIVMLPPPPSATSTQHVRRREEYQHSSCHPSTPSTTVRHTALPPSATPRPPEQRPTASKRPSLFSDWPPTHPRSPQTSTSLEYQAGVKRANREKKKGRPKQHNSTDGFIFDSEEMDADPLPEVRLSQLTNSSSAHPQATPKPLALPQHISPARPPSMTPAEAHAAAIAEIFGDSDDGEVLSTQVDSSDLL